ncbi:MAG: T9SS type A sorting domain-containing protein [Bacteroidota bacterium]
MNYFGKTTQTSFILRSNNGVSQPEDLETAAVIQAYRDFMAKEDMANTLLQLLRTEEQSRLINKIDSARFWNASLQSPTQYEEMEQIINEIFLSTIAVGNFSFDAQQMNKIKQIAYSCPLMSPSAVYKAREMYGIDHPLANFDNELFCSGIGSQFRTENTNAGGDLFVSQVSSRLQIEVGGNTDYLDYKIFNNLGQLIHRWKSNSRQQTIDASNILLSNGIYILQAQTTDGTQSSKKFIYSR